MLTRLGSLATVAAWLVLSGRAEAQVVREDGVSSVAGLLGAYDDFTFRSVGGEILFADLDADVYQTQGRRMGDHEEEGEEGGGCSGEDSGPGGLCLQVLDATGNLLCWADRPMRPGWQRDPNLACPLPAAAEYTLRVARRGAEEAGCGQTLVYFDPDEGDVLPYLLNVALRKIGPTGSLLRAIGVSTSVR